MNVFKQKWLFLYDKIMICLKNSLKISFEFTQSLHLPSAGKSIRRVALAKPVLLPIIIFIEKTHKNCFYTAKNTHFRNKNVFFS